MMYQTANVPGAPGNLAGIQMASMGRVYPGMLPMTTMSATPFAQGMTYGASQIPPQAGQGAQMGMMPQGPLDVMAAANEKSRRVSGNMVDYAIAGQGQQANYDQAQNAGMLSQMM